MEGALTTAQHLVGWLCDPHLKPSAVLTHMKSSFTSQATSHFLSSTLHNPPATLDRIQARLPCSSVKVRVQACVRKEATGHGAAGCSSLGDPTGWVGLTPFTFACPSNHRKIGVRM